MKPKLCQWRHQKATSNAQYHFARQVYKVIWSSENVNSIIIFYILRNAALQTAVAYDDNFSLAEFKKLIFTKFFTKYFRWNNRNIWS